MKRRDVDAMRKLSRCHSPVDAKLVAEFLGIRKMVDWPAYIQELLKATAESRVPVEALLLQVRVLFFFGLVEPVDDGVLALGHVDALDLGLSGRTRRRGGWDGPSSGP